MYVLEILRECNILEINLWKIKFKFTTDWTSLIGEQSQKTIELFTLFFQFSGVDVFCKIFTKINTNIGVFSTHIYMQNWKI